MVGPTTYLMRADSATVARVWSRNTTTKISASEEAQSGQRREYPVDQRRRLLMIRAIARAPTSSGATAISPCGASVTLKTATMIASAAGHSRRVPMEFSTRTQAAMAPNAISGSGRSPLLNGSHAARNTAPAVHTATRLCGEAAAESRQHAAADDQPGADGRQRWPGRRIHTLAVLIDARCASTDWYQSNGASLAPKKR